MIALTIPVDDRRAHVRSFWAILSATLTLPWLILAWWLHAPAMLMLLLVAFLLAAAIPRLHRSFGWRVYRAWNRRIVNPYSAWMATLVTKIAFFVVFVAVSRVGPSSHSSSGRTATTSWTTRGSLSKDAYAALYAAASAPRASGSWIRDYVQWARHTENLWSVALIPYFLLLMVLRGEDEQSAPANIYTLF
jgi:hypothetical protein